MVLVTLPEDDMIYFTAPRRVSHYPKMQECRGMGSITAVGATVSSCRGGN